MDHTVLRQVTCFAGAQHLGGGVLSRFVPRAKSNPFAFESVLTCFPLGSLRLVLPVCNTPHESFPTTSDFDLTPHPLSPSVQSRLLLTQRPQRTHVSEDDRVTGHHVADHVTDAQPRATHATSSAGHPLGLPGSWGFQPPFLSFCQHTSFC